MTTKSPTVHTPPLTDLLRGDGAYLREAIDLYIKQVAEEDGLLHNSSCVDDSFRDEIERISEVLKKLSVKVDLTTEGEELKNNFMYGTGVPYPQVSFSPLFSSSIM